MNAEADTEAALAHPSRDALHNLCLADPVWTERYEGWTYLGHGGSATVVRTHGKALDEDLALKVFPRLSHDEWTRFRREVGTAQRLTSPYIVRTYSPFPRGSFAWIELELVDGIDLRQEMERREKDQRPFAHREAIAVALAVARALESAHAAGVTHRDVKPANILIPRSGEPAAKLGDFGISRPAGAARLTQTGLLVGTPQFASPEVVAGDQAGPAADVYAFSLCLYLMLSGGRPPFPMAEEALPTHWLRAHAEVRPLPITAFDASAPRWLQELLQRGLEKDPARRPDAAALVAALAAADRDAVTAQQPAVRRRRPVLLGLAAAALATAAALGFWQRREHAPAAPAEAPTAPPIAAAPSQTPAPVAALVAPTPSPRASVAAPPPPSPAASGGRPEATPPVEEPTPSPLAEASATPEPVATPAAAAPTPTPLPVSAATPVPEAPARPAAPVLHLDELLHAQPMAIGRREGLPGQPEMVLVDALRGDERIWFRFKLEGGAARRVSRVSWEQGDITTFVQEAAGKDLRLLVQVPRAAVTRGAHLSLETASGPTYTFALGDRSLGRFLKELFR